MGGEIATGGGTGEGGAKKQDSTSKIAAQESSKTAPAQKPSSNSTEQQLSSSSVEKQQQQQQQQTGVHQRAGGQQQQSQTGEQRQQHQGGPGGGVSGECSVCGDVFKLTNTGMLRKHGHGHGRPQCPGSGRQPRGQARAADETIHDLVDLSQLGMSDSAAGSGPGFCYARPSRGPLKRIPAGARQRAATLFERRLREVTARPDDIRAWKDLLEFGGCLSQPQRGGVQRNFTSLVIKQIDRSEAGLPPQPSQDVEAPAESSRRTKRSARHQPSPEEAAAKRASAKLEAGDVRGAVRQLCSDETIAPHDDVTLQRLRAKHPPCPPDRRRMPDFSSAPMSVSPDDIRQAIKGFTPGSAGGPDGLKPQHLVDMSAKGISGGLIEALADFCNLALSGGVPVLARAHFFGGTLHAFNKNDGGIRPIAVGLTLRRLVSKVACTKATEKCKVALAPRQLGVGVKGGAEAVAHAARRYLAEMGPDQVLVKLDFINAFNSVRRDAVLEAVAQHIPELLAFTVSAYGAPSILQFGDEQVLSEEGIQQGDPLGPLLFSLALNGPLQDLRGEFVSGYLDDVSVGGRASVVLMEVTDFEAKTAAIGLHLNHAKCEVIGLPRESLSAWSSSGLSFAPRKPEEATLLGAPLHIRGIDKAIGEKCEALQRAMARLKHMSAHEAMYILRNSLSVPRLQYILRCAPSFNSSLTATFDDLVLQALSTSANIEMDGAARVQAQLPVRWGGLGLRSATQLAPSAFLSSLTAAESLLRALLPPALLAAPDPNFDAAISCWQALGGASTPAGETAERQRSWDDQVCSSQYDSLVAAASGPAVRARLLAVKAEGSGAWLQALPASSLGLRLGDDELRIAVGLRLGAPLVRPHTCCCGQPVAANGHHGLACRRSAGRHVRHRLANEIIARAFRSAEVPADLEPQGLLRGDGKRPDGATLIPWSRGKHAVWDFTCPDTLAPSHLAKTSLAVGSAAQAAEANKRVKYAGLGSGYTFYPVAIETLGAWGKEAQGLVSELGGRLAALTGEPRSLTFLRQRLGIAMMRGNAAAIRGTLPDNISPLAP